MRAISFDLNDFRPHGGLLQGLPHRKRKGTNWNFQAEKQIPPYGCHYVLLAFSWQAS